MLKKIMAASLAAVMVLALTACGDKEEEETTAKAKDVMATEAVTNAEGETVTVENEEDEGNNEEITEESESDETTQKSDSETETEKSDSKTTTKKSDTKTTTKADKSMKIPASKAEIVNAYKAAANKTKAQQNMDIDKTAKVDIVIDKVMSMEFAGTIANNIAGKYMNQWDGKDIMNEVFVNGKPTNDLERTKDTFMPLYGEKEMCTISPNEVTSAKVTKKSKDSYQIEIKLKDDSCGVNDKPPVLSKGMDYFDTRLYGFDEIGLAFLSGTIKYTNAVIKATINSDGYVDYIEHEMHLKTTDSKIAYQSIKIPGYVALHGSYLTTFTFK